MSGDERLGFELDDGRGERVFIKSGGAGAIVKMRVAAMAESLMNGRFFLQKRRAFRAESGSFRKKTRLFPAFPARCAVRRVFNRFAANPTRLRVSES